MPNIPGYNGDIQKAQFYQKYGEAATKWAQDTGIPASIYLAMLASETNWGRADSMFGIKGSGTAGSKSYDTYEVVDGKNAATKDNFAVYSNIDEGKDAFIKLLSTEPRYKAAWDQFQKTGDAQGLISGINQAGYATDPKWSEKISSVADDIRKEYFNGNEAPMRHSFDSKSATPVTANSRITEDPSKMPDPNNYYETDETGATFFNQERYNSAIVAHTSWQQSRQADRDYQIGPQAEAIDALIKEISDQISAGNLDLNKANSIFKNRVDSLKTMSDIYSSDGFKYAARPGDQYVQGREPGGFWDKQGLGPLNADHSNTFDPLQEAMAANSQQQQSISGIQTPAVPSYYNMVTDAYNGAGTQMPGQAGPPRSPTLGVTLPESINGANGTQPRMAFGGPLPGSSPKDLLQQALMGVREQGLIGSTAQQSQDSPDVAAAQGPTRPMAGSDNGTVADLSADALAAWILKNSRSSAQRSY